MVSCNSGVTKRAGERGQLPPGAVDEGPLNSLAKNILTTIKVSLIEVC